MLQWLCTILTVIFVTLKVTGHLAWGWLAVLSPAIGFLTLCGLVVVAAVVLKAVTDA